MKQGYGRAQSGTGFRQFCDGRRRIRRRSAWSGAVRVIAPSRRCARPGRTAVGDCLRGWLSDKPQIVGPVTSDVTNSDLKMGRQPQSGGRFKVIMSHSMLFVCIYPTTTWESARPVAGLVTIPLGRIRSRTPRRSLRSCGRRRPVRLALTQEKQAPRAAFRTWEGSQRTGDATRAGSEAESAVSRLAGAIGRACPQRNKRWWLVVRPSRSYSCRCRSPWRVRSRTGQEARALS